MAVYQAMIGKTYAQTRRSDPRIATKLLEILQSSQASTMADIAAGTGSYAVILAEFIVTIISLRHIKLKLVSNCLWGDTLKYGQAG